MLGRGGGFLLWGHFWRQGKTEAGIARRILSTRLVNHGGRAHTMWTTPNYQPREDTWTSIGSWPSGLWSWAHNLCYWSKLKKFIWLTYVVVGDIFIVTSNPCPLISSHRIVIIMGRTSAVFWGLSDVQQLCIVGLHYGLPWYLCLSVHI